MLLYGVRLSHAKNLSFDFMACDGRTPGIFFLGRPDEIRYDKDN